MSLPGRLVGAALRRGLPVAVRGAEAVRRRRAARPGSPASTRLAALEREVGDVLVLLAEQGHRGAWLVHAAVRGELPDRGDVEATARVAELDGPQAALSQVLGLPASRGPVHLLRDAVLVDVEHTSRTELATGIQRVARLTTRAWAREHEVTPVAWTRDQRALRHLPPDDAQRLLGGVRLPRPAGGGPAVAGVVVPLGGAYLLPELAVERRRTDRIGALAAYAGLRTGVIGFDCVPVTSAETTDPGMGAAFAGNLAALRDTDVVAAISASAAGEYEGWVRMVAESGVPGPQVRSVPLPVVPLASAAAPEDVVRARLGAGEEPLLLCVGSHEPRKNHLALVHAAELTWRRGIEFRLVLVGGNAWRSEELTARVDELVAAGRPLTSVRALDDSVLAGAYRAARAVVFPSLTEGYGLPVAEALACGTPVVTTGYGSTAEIAAAGGALLVDPRDDADLQRGIEAVLVDDALHARLAGEAAARPHHSWDGYAAALWDAFAPRGPAPAAGTVTGGTG